MVRCGLRGPRGAPGLGARTTPHNGGVSRNDSAKCDPPACGFVTHLVHVDDASRGAIWANPDPFGPHRNAAVLLLLPDDDVGDVAADGVAAAEGQSCIADRVEAVQHPRAKISEVVAGVGGEKFVQAVEGALVYETPVQPDQLDDRQSVFDPKRHGGIVITAATSRALGCVIQTDGDCP